MPFDASPAGTAGLLTTMDRTIETLRDEARWGRREEISAVGRYCLIGALKAAGGGERSLPLSSPPQGASQGSQSRASTSSTTIPSPAIDDPVTSHRQLMAVLKVARQEIARSP